MVNRGGSLVHSLFLLTREIINKHMYNISHKNIYENFLENIIILEIYDVGWKYDYKKNYQSC